MATITSQERTNITKLVVGMFNAAPGAAYLAEFTAAYQGMGNSLANLATALGNTGAFKALYPSYLTATEFATKFLTTLGLQGNQEANDWVVAKVNGGTSYSSVILQAVTAISNTNDAAYANAKALLDKKTTVAEYYSVTQGTSSEDLGVLQGSIANVKFDSDVSNADAIKQLIGGGASTGVELTLGRDVINAAVAGQTFEAPVVQNQLGAVANTFETGDVINATGTGNKLAADIVASVVVANAPAPAISATTKNVQVVEFRTQSTGQTGGGVHGEQANIDAQKMQGVKEWWTVNSRTDLTIEDVRTRPEDTTIGMRNTDPEVSFKVYFDPEQLKNNGTVKNSALTLTLDSVLTPGNLTEVPVDGVGFYLGGTLYQLKSDTIGAATNHTELLAALKAAAAAIPALKDVTFTLNANNSITLVDPAGQEFKVGGWQFVNNQVPPAGNIKFDQAVGEPVRGIELITTTVELDNVGRTSAGGTLDISSLGNLGVEKFNVNVDRSSWLVKMKSTDHAGNGASVVDDEDGQAEYLQEVHLANKGANGNLKVGTTVSGRLDGRVAEGLTDVRVVDGSAFKGVLNLGINLTNNGNNGSVVRYLDKSTTPVEFNYTGGVNNDLLNVDVATAVANHKNFVMNINAGAGDDRVVLTTGGRLNTTSVDGGTGTNTIVVAANVGIDGAGQDSLVNAFKSFKNFQNYEIEAGNHNFTGLTGVQNVVVANVNGGQSNILRNLPAELSSVVVTGKNQTAAAGQGNAAQTFATLDFQAAKAAELTVKLQNTALVDANLSVATLSVQDDPNNNVTNLSAVRTLNVQSNGVSGAQTTNTIGSIDAAKVNNFNFAGEHALTATLNAASNVAASGAFTAAQVTDLKVDGSAMTAALSLTVNKNVANAVDSNKTASYKGGQGTKDKLTFTSGVATTAKTAVSGFETLVFSDGQFNAVNTTGVTLYQSKADVAADLKLIGLQANENAQIGSFNATTHLGTNVGNEHVLKTNSGGSGSALNLSIKEAAAGVQKLTIDGFKTVNLKLDVVADAGNQKAFQLDLSDVKAKVGAADAVTVQTLQDVFDDIDLATANPADRITLKGAAINSATDKIVVTGGVGAASGAGTTADSLALGNVSNTIKWLDVSGYKGSVTGTITEAQGNGGAVGTTLVTTGNTEVKVGAYGINFADTDHSDPIATVTTFTFTTDAVKLQGTAQEWQISNFQGKNAHGAAADANFSAGAALGDVTVLDLSALGIKGQQDLNIVQTTVSGVAFDGDLNTGTALADSKVVITSNSNHNFKIVLTGVFADQLSQADNFNFAS